MSKWITSSLLCMGFAFACGGGSGGGSGVSGSKKIIDLSAGERQDVCELFVDILGPERMVDCGNGDIRTVGGEDPAECVTELSSLATGAPNCTVTVSQYQACIDAIADLSDAEICAGGSFPAQCAPVASAECLGE